MNKTALFFLFTLLFPFNPSSAQEISLEEFQGKAQGHYYDYKKEGMKGFHCRVQSKLFDQLYPGGNKKSDLINDLMIDFSRSILRPVYDMAYDLKNVKIYDQWDALAKSAEDKNRLQEILKPANEEKMDKELRKTRDKFLKSLKTMKKTVEIEVRIWALLASPPGSTRSEERLDVTKTLKTQEGYELHAGMGKDLGFFYFNHDFQLTRLVIHTKGKEPITLNTDYEKTPKGWRIRACELTYQKTVYKAKTAYRTVDDYYVPSKIEVSMANTASKNDPVFDILTFDDYNIDW